MENSSSSEAAEDHRGDGARRRIVKLLQTNKDHQRRHFRLPRDVAGDKNHRAEFAEAAGKRQSNARQQRRRQLRQHHLAETLPARSAQRFRRFLILGPQLFQHRLHGAYHKRDAGEGHRHGDAEPV